MSKIYALILAAGKGTRMPSRKPKALQNILGNSMISYVYRALDGLGADTWTVIGHQGDMVQAHLRGIFGEDAEKRCVLQDKQLGTGHAVQCAMAKMQESIVFEKNDKILIVNADTPLLTTDILKELSENVQNLEIGFLSLVLDDAAAYGRVMRKNFEQTGENTGALQGIMEAKDFRQNFAEHIAKGHEVCEINTGIYMFDAQALNTLLPKLSSENVGGEYYLTDCVGLGLAEGLSVDAICVSHKNELLGVNNPYELSLAEKTMQEKENKRRMQNGVTMHNPENIYISPLAEVEAGTELFGPCEIYGNSKVGAYTCIESHCVLINATIGQDCRIRSHCHFEDCVFEEAVIAGPYARVRPQSHIAKDAHLGNFVEIKKSYIGDGSKVNHLSYIGDTKMGKKVNVGAGSITCNYDGKNKFQTTIEDYCFLGSNTSYVAPVKVGTNSLIAAGSVITHDVPENSLSVARQRQKNIGKK